MSNLYYNQKWEEAINDLLEQITLENKPLEESAEKGLAYKRTDQEWFQFYASLYIKYIDCYKKLQDCYDQLVHPQKRELLKSMLENSMVRICEVKANLVRYSTHSLVVQSDFVNLDEVIIDMKLTTDALQIPIPRYFREQHPIQAERRSNMLDRFMLEYHDTTEPEEEVFQDSKLKASDDNAIRIIQTLQRGRQGIQRCKLTKFYMKQAQNNNEKSLNLEAKEEEQITAATTIVQAFIRAYIARKKLVTMRAEQSIFLGISRPFDSEMERQNLVKANVKRQKMKLKQDQFAKNYISDIRDLKRQVETTEGPDMKQKMLDDRRKWIQACPQLPKKSVQFYQKDLVEPKPQANKKDKKSQKKEAAKKDKKDPKKAKKTGLDEFLDQHEKTGPTEVVLKMQIDIQKHDIDWGQRDQTQNFDQKYVPQVARDLVRPQVEEMVRKNIDDLIDIELDNLRVKYGIKLKKKKEKKKKPPKGPKVKIPQGLGKKPVELLFEQLVMYNIIKKLKPACMSDLIGEYNPLSSLIEKHSQLMPDPSIAQLRSVLSQLVAIPLGSQYVKERLEERMNWFLFYGPMGTGKTLAIRAIASQCNALVFDLSVSNLEGKFVDKQGWTRMLWMTIICAKEYKPSIIMLDEFQLIFPVKKKKTSSSVPNCGPKLKKPMADMRKNKLWVKTDRIAVIACTSRPYEASTKELKKLFDRKFYFPYPNYSTRKMIISHMIEQKGVEVPPSLSINNFAHITEGFTGGSVLS